MPPPNHSTLQWHPAMAPCNGTHNVHRPLPQSWSSPSPQTIANYNGTLQWHHVHSSKVGRHPPPQTIAHYNGTLQWHRVHSPKVRGHPIAHYSGTLQWHHAHSPKVGRHRPAHYNGTLQWHLVLLQSWPSPSPAPTIAHYNGTLRWHSNGTTSSAPCSGTLVPRPIRQSGSSPSPPIGSKNPYSYRYLGKNKKKLKIKAQIIHSQDP